MPKRLAIDANLLVLLAVGQVERTWIAKHRRLRSNYTEGDFEFLTRVIGSFESVLLTPNAATEAVNLIAFGVVDPLRTRFVAALGQIFNDANEHYVRSAEVSLRPEFLRLGLSDVAWLAVLDRDAVLLTADRELHSAAAAGGCQTFYFKDARDNFKGGSTG